MNELINCYPTAEAQIAPDPEQLKCGGIIDAARITNGAIGESVKQSMEQLALTVLNILVVNEEVIVQKGPITLYTKM